MKIKDNREKLLYLLNEYILFIMAKISKREIYPQDPNVTFKDYVIGTNFNTINKKTNTYDIGSIFALFNDGLGNLNYIFSSGSAEDITVGSPGYIFGLDELGEYTSAPSLIKKLAITRYDASLIDVTPLLTSIFWSQSFILNLSNRDNKNNFSFFKTTTFTVTETAIIVDVEVMAGLFNEPFQDLGVYSMALNVNSSSQFLNQNNIFKFINLEKRLFEFNIDDVVSVINSIPQYTVEETDNIGYAINIYTPSGPLTYKFILTGMGKGIYGAGQPMQVTASNLELVYKENSLQGDLLQGETQYVNLGEIGDVLPAVFINNFNGEIEFQNVDQGPVIINTFNNGIAVDYLYVGPNGIFGQGLEQTNSYYFYQFNDDSDIDIPTISTDNSPRNIYLAIEPPMTSAKALVAVNNAPTFTQADNDVIHFIALLGTASRQAYRFRILGLGAGTYGIDGTPIVGANRIDFMGVPTAPIAEDIAGLPNTQTLTWGDVNPSDFLNGQNPAIELIDPEDGAVLVITDTGNYIFQGGGGFWGVGAQQSDMTMFFPLDDVPTAEEPKPNEVFLVDFAALGISSFEEATQEMVIDWINSQPYVNAEAVIIKLVAELPPPPSNDRFFDVRMDWEGEYGVTDEQTFSDTFEIEVENFVLLEDGNRIQCDYISGGGGGIQLYDAVIFALPRISWDSLETENTSFGVDFVFPESFYSVRLSDYPDASIPDLPTDILDNLTVLNAPNLTSFPDLPPTVVELVAVNCPLIDQVAIDKLATEFLQGDLPKDYWDSTDTIEPSAALKQQIIDNTAFGAQF